MKAKMKIKYRKLWLFMIGAARPSDMEAYYSPEEQRQYGVVGIELLAE